MGVAVLYGRFEWDRTKEECNIHVHGVDFRTAALAFADPVAVIAVDEEHSDKEDRHFCIGKVNGKVVTVRFVYRKGRVRIFGAGFWRKGRQHYEKENRR